MSDSPVPGKGFESHNMVVVPAPIRLASASHPLLRNLLVTDAGYFPHAAKHYVERPHGSATHLMIVCLQGGGWVRGTERVEIKPGDVAWLSANHPHSYGANDEMPWTIVWAHFCGEELPHWQRELGWSTKLPVWTAHITPNHTADLGLDRVCDLLELGYAVPQLLEASAALRTTFCALIRLMQQSDAERSAMERTALVRDELVRNPARVRRLEELSVRAGLSVPHFSLLFRQLTGYAPIDFLIRERIKIACHRLDCSQASVAQIADEVGFSDPYYFSRCFRRIMGSPPIEYRKTVKA